MPLQGGQSFGGEVVTLKVEPSHERVGRRVIVGGGRASLVNVPAPLFQSEVEAMRHEANHHAKTLEQLCARLLASAEMEAAAGKHVHTARAELAAALVKAEGFSSRTGSMRLENVSSMGCWVGMAFCIGAQLESNLRLRRKLLAVANGGRISGSDTLVPETPAGSTMKSVLRVFSSKSLFKQAGNVATAITRVTSKRADFHIDETCHVSVRRGWNEPRVPDDLLYVRESHPELPPAYASSPTEPERLPRGAHNGL